MKLKTVAVLCCLFSAQGLVFAQNLPAPPPLPSKAGPFAKSLPHVDPEADRRFVQSLELQKRGDGLLERKQWKEASALFRESVEKWYNRQAYYGLAQCALAQGDKEKALENYRLACYAKTDQGIQMSGGVLEWQSFEFALFLSQVGLDEEAMFVYNTLVPEQNYRDGKQDVKVLFPEFGLKPGQRTYITAHFQSMVHVAIAKTINDGDKAFEHLKEAVSVYPKSGVAQFYLAEAMRHVSPDAARAAYEKAKQLDPKAIGQEADKAANSGSLWRPSTEAPATPTTPTKSAPPATP